MSTGGVMYRSRFRVPSAVGVPGWGSGGAMVLSAMMSLLSGRSAGPGLSDLDRDLLGFRPFRLGERHEQEPGAVIRLHLGGVYLKRELDGPPKPAGLPLAAVERLGFDVFWMPSFLA